MTKRGRYSAEFKRQALKQADEPGVTDLLVAEELGVSTRQRLAISRKRGLRAP